MTIPRSPSEPRRRLPKAARHEQLLDAARDLIRESGTDEFSLIRLADRAGVTKPLVYDHFGDRSGVLAELYRDFESRRRATLAIALRGAEPELSEIARLVASAYIDCCVAEGTELADVVSALSGSATLVRVREEAETEYLTMCRAALAPFTADLDEAALRAMIGAGDALARRALTGAITVTRARTALALVVSAFAAEEEENTP